MLSPYICTKSKCTFLPSIVTVPPAYVQTLSLLSLHYLASQARPDLRLSRVLRISVYGVYVHNFPKGHMLLHVQSVYGCGDSMHNFWQGY